MELSTIGSTAMARHDATETIVGGGPSTVIHDQDIRNAELRVTAELGIRSWLTAGFVVPLRVFGTSIRYLDPSGQDVDIENPFIHHHNETLVGIADPLVAARFARRAGGFTLGMRVGVTLPLGRTEEDPFALGDMGLTHEHSQFGTGTFQPVIGLDAARVFGRVRTDVFALAIQSLYENGHGYFAGDRYAFGVGASSSLGAKRWRFRVTAESQVETAERWNGKVHTDEGNTGRVDVLAGAEVTYRASADWYVAAIVKLPVFTHVDGGQLDPSAFVGVNVGTQFHLFEEADHDHGHAHHDHEDDVVQPLVPELGKITVYDFWASWCAPCRVLDHELVEVVRRHPDDIVVKKYQLEDTDGPSGQKYLGAATLPHVKVFGRDGALLWERSAPPLVLAGEVEKLVSTSPKPAAVAGARKIAIGVGDTGYVPERISIRVGEPVILVFTRSSEKTCATDVHFALPDGRRIDEELPLGKAVEIPLVVERPGDIIYACGMDMNHGTIEVK